MQSPLAFTVLTTTVAVAGITAVATTPESTPSEPTAQVASIPTNDECVEGDYVSALFAPGTDPEVVERVSQAIQNVDHARFELTGRWPGSSGQPVNLTYSFPSDGLNVPSGVGEGSGPNSINAMFVSRFGSVAAGKAKIAQAFAQWAQFTGNTYTEVSDDDAPMFNSPGPLNGGSGRGDLRIVAKAIDGGSGILAYNFFPGSSGGDMVLDAAENWGSSANDFRFFRNTVTHEHGHGQGLLHVCPVSGTILMEPFLNTGFDGPQHDDIRATTSHYGDRFEPNNNPASATFLGFYAADGGASEGTLALHNGGDNDYFSIDVDGPSHIDFSVTPIGFTYQSGPQTQACNSGDTINSLTLIDPSITVYDTDGVTVLASSDTSGPGVTESLTNAALPAAGTYFVKVVGPPFSLTDQLYDLTLGVTIDPVVGCLADLNGDMIVDTADLGILIAAFGGAGPIGDLNNDSTVDTADLGILIGVFGTCTAP